MEQVNKMIDHTILKADATEQAVEKVCQEALANDFASVCINPYWVKKAAELLADSDVKVCTVIGFPLGANTKEVKVFEAKQAIQEGAQEVDMVINIGALKSGLTEAVLAEIKAVVEAAGSTLVKVIIETALLTDEEKVAVCKLAVEAGAEYVKTSTGFSTGGATVDDVALMKQTVGDKALVKASGGVRTKEDAEAMIKAGASRLGTSNGIQIVS